MQKYKPHTTFSPQNLELQGRSKPGFWSLGEHLPCQHQAAVLVLELRLLCLLGEPERLNLMSEKDGVNPSPVLLPVINT